MDQISELQQTLEQIKELKARADQQRKDLCENGQALQITSFNNKRLVKEFSIRQLRCQEHKDYTFIIHYPGGRIHRSSFERAGPGKKFKDPSRHHYGENEIKEYNKAIKETTIYPTSLFKYITPAGEEMIFPVKDYRKNLEPYLTPAAYGDTLEGKTKVDSTVRKALQLDGVELILPDITEIKENVDDPDDTHTTTRVNNLSDIFDRQLQDFFSGRKVKYIPHSLNVYPPGGHFTKHVDTPRHDHGRMIGTIVIKIKEDSFYDSYNCVFFFGDVPHEVKENKGFEDRVTITYDVVLDDQEVMALTPNAKLNRVLMKYTKNIIIFCLVNEYTVEALNQGVMKCDHDVKLYQQLLSTGKKIQLEHVFINAQQKRVKINHPYSCDEEEINFDKVLKESEREYVTDQSYDTLSLILPKNLPIPDDAPYNQSIIIVNPFANPNNITKQTEVSDETYFYTGNEHDEGIQMVCNRVYNSSAIILHNY